VQQSHESLSEREQDTRICVLCRSPGATTSKRIPQRKVRRD
jgi:hypothetical protein